MLLHCYTRLKSGYGHKTKKKTERNCQKELRVCVCVWGLRFESPQFRGPPASTISRFANETIKSGRERERGRNYAPTRALVCEVVVLAVNG